MPLKLTTLFLLFAICCKAQQSLYDDGNIRLTYTTTVLKTVNCSNKKGTIYFVTAKYHLENYSSKNWFVNLAWGMNFIADGNLCAADDEVSHFSYQATSSGLEGTVKAGANYYGEDGAWFTSKYPTPGWKIIVKALQSAPKTSTNNGPNTTKTSTQSKQAGYGIYQNDNIVNPKPQIDYAQKQAEEDKATAEKLKAAKEQEKQKQEQIKKQQDAAERYKQEQLEKQKAAQLQAQKKLDEIKKNSQEQTQKTNEALNKFNNSVDDITNTVVADMNKKNEEEKRQREEEWKKFDEKNKQEEEQQVELARQRNNEKDNELLEKFNSGIEYSKAGNYKDAIAVFQDCIKNGSIKLYANFALGVLYYHGVGVDKDYTKAFLLLKTLGNVSSKSSQGLVDYFFQIKTPLLEDYITQATYFLAVMYENGQGIDQNIQEAMNWYKIAAGRGNAEAQKKMSNSSTSTNTNKEDIKKKSAEAIITNLNKIVSLKFGLTFTELMKYEFGIASTKLPNYNSLKKMTCSSPDDSYNSYTKSIVFSKSFEDSNSLIIKRNSKTLNSIINYLHNNGFPNLNFLGNIGYFFSEGRLIEISITIEQPEIQNSQPENSEGVDAFCNPILKTLNNGIELPNFSAIESNNIHYKIFKLWQFESEGRYRNQLIINIGSEIAFKNWCLFATLN